MHLRFFTVICTLFLLSFVATAQRKEGKESGYSPQQADTAKVNALILQIFTLRETDPGRAINLCLETIGLSKQLGFSKGVGRATGSLGWIYFRQGDFVKALEYSIEALNISEKIDDKPEIARCLNNMAAIYNEEKQYGKSLNNLKQALVIAHQVGDVKSIARTLNNIALLNMQAWKNLDSAQKYATQALELSSKNKDNYNGAFANRTLGDMYVARGEDKAALKSYFKSLELSDEISYSLKTETWNRIAEAYMNQGRLTEAIPVLTKNIEVTRKYGLREPLARCYHLLSDAYARQGMHAVSLDYLKRYTTLHDSIYNDQNGMQLATLQTQFDLALKEKQIELLTIDKLLSKKEITQQQIKLYTTIGGLVTIALIATLLLYANRKVSFANALLEKQKEELASKNEEVEFKSQELEAQANELALLNATKDKLFSIIGHDFRSPLNSLKGTLALLENRDLTQDEFTSIAGALKSNLDSVSTTLENLLQWSLAQIQGIQTNPVRVNIHTMVGEHIVLFRELAKAKSIRLENEISENAFALSDENHTRLVLRNLINNAIKFTRPGGVVRISNERAHPFIKVKVADTGVGIAPDQLRTFFMREKVLSKEGTNHEKGVGIGLLLCQEFVENNGGRLSVDSEPGKGSVFSFTLKAA